MADARSLLERIASHPRAAGSAAEGAARAFCADRLGALGFDVREEPFEYSGFPGRVGTPLGGICSVVLLLAAAAAGAVGAPLGALAVLVVGGVLVGAFALVLARDGVLRLPWMRARAVNLVATRGEPAVWLVAHLDTKSQPVPIAVRALGVMGSIAAWLGAVGVAVAQGAGAIGGAAPGAWGVVAGLGIIAALPVMASIVGDRSPGALDDASGVVTVLLAVERSPGDLGVGVLLTSAEELGLAGARAWARGRAAGRAINVDGVDDEGGVRLTWTRRPPRAMIDALASAAEERGVRARSAPLLPGVLVDGVALADRGWEVVTVSRGSWRTVARIHTPRDDLRALGGEGASEAAWMIARAMNRLG